jgi:hypothetical protein
MIEATLSVVVDPGGHPAAPKSVYSEIAGQV